MKTFLPLLLAILSTPYVLAAGDTWLPPSRADVRVTNAPADGWKINSNARGEFTLDSAQRYPAAVGDSFEIRVRIQVDLTTQAAAGVGLLRRGGPRDPGPFLAGDGADNDDHRLAVVPPRATGPPRHGHGFARIGGGGRGQIGVADLEFRPKKIDPYETGALITQTHPKLRSGVVLESNLGIVNSESRQHGGPRWRRQVGRDQCRPRSHHAAGNQGGRLADALRRQSQ